MEKPRKARLHWRERVADRNAAITAMKIRESWKRCLRHLWMEILQSLDVGNCRRFSRVSRTWKRDLLAVPTYNRGIMLFSFPAKYIGNCFDDGLDAFIAPENRLPSATKRTRVGCTVREWWCGFLGVCSLDVMRHLIFENPHRSNFGVAKYFGGLGGENEDNRHITLLASAPNLTRYTVLRSFVELSDCYGMLCCKTMGWIYLPAEKNSMKTVEFVLCDVKLKPPPAFEMITFPGLPRLVLDVATVKRVSREGEPEVHLERWLMESVVKYDGFWPFTEKHAQWLALCMENLVKDSVRRRDIKMILSQLDTFKKHCVVPNIPASTVTYDGRYLDKMECDFVGRYFTQEGESFISDHSKCSVYYETEFTGQKRCSDCMHPAEVRRSGKFAIKSLDF